MCIKSKFRTIWILTEERPKIEVLRQILKIISKDYCICGSVDQLRLIPLVQDKKFLFTYQLVGFRLRRIRNIYIKTVSGYSAFIDYLVFLQDHEPRPESDEPAYAIEETKTDDSESRNTGVYQRCTKFVYLDSFYPNTRKIMLYNLQIDEKEDPTETNIFGTKMLLTNGVRIYGKKHRIDQIKPFCSVDELIRFKKSMRRAPAGNVPILIEKSTEGNMIYISGRLEKSGGLNHDPNIGALSIISATLRKLGWTGKIIIQQHGLNQGQVRPGNKFVRVANLLNIELSNLEMPEAKASNGYWYYDRSGEKIGTIFLHIAIESFSQAYSIYENHAGCERGYFLDKDGKRVTVGKYINRDSYKAGDKKAIINLPDLTILDISRKEIIDIEGETYKNKLNGIAQLELFDAFESKYIGKSYQDCSICRTVVLYGGDSSLPKPLETEVSFILYQDGSIYLSADAPAIFKDVISRIPGFGAKKRWILSNLH